MLDQAVERKLNDNLLLFFTGIQRYASSIEAEKQNNRSSNLQTLTVISDMVDEAMNLLTSKKPKLREFGSLLDDSWKLKRSLSKNVSNKKIDEAYDAAKSCGALGGKILGAGGGGFMLFYAPKQIHHAIISRLKPFVHVPFRFEKTGSSIALYQPSGYR